MTPFSPVLLISPDGGSARGTADAALSRLGDALHDLGYGLVRASSTDEGLTLIDTQPAFAAVVLDWNLGDGRQCPNDAALAIIDRVRTSSWLMPVFLAVERESPATLPLPVARDVHGYLHPLAEPPETTAHRLDFAVRQYYAGLLPPYLRALKQQVDDGPSLWGGTGHHGGEAYRRHPVGAEFERMFGDGLARADVGTRPPQLGDNLRHLGAAADSERRAARVFGADWSYLVLGGSSAANRIILNGIVARDDLVVADRSCHQSVIHGVILAGARPVYLKPPYNGHGMIGPIAPWCLAPGHIREVIEHSPLARGAASSEPVLGVITNSTYDGLCCDVERVVSTLGRVVPRLHFDEAAYGYAHMHSLYDGRHAMNGAGEGRPDRPTVFAVQSAHEMLPALSMASLLHGRSSPRAPVDAQVFNESFQMHGTTSPFNPILASIDVATAMMEAPAGPALVERAIRDAIAFRQAMAGTRARFLESHGSDAWFFDVFQPPQVEQPGGGGMIAFTEASPDMLVTHPECWTLKSTDQWHGFAEPDVENGHALVDPMKVTLVCPGADATGAIGTQGIPACVLTRFLDERRIYLARTGVYTALVRFAVGLDEGRWGAVLESLHEFKRLYDNGVTVGEALPRFADTHPRYANMALRSLCDRMHAAMTALDLLRLGRDALGVDPQPVVTPAAAYQDLLRGRTHLVPLREAPGRIAAVIVAPSPPGTSLLLPGERFGTATCAILRYLEALEAFDRTFTGFEHDLHGIERDDAGTYLVRVVVEERSREVSSARGPARSPRYTLHDRSK